MLLLLVAIILGLGGLLTFGVVGISNFDSLPPLPIAAAVATTLVVLYLASHSGWRRDAGLLKVIAGIAAIAIIITAGWSFRDRVPMAVSSLVSANSHASDRLLEDNAPASVRIRRAEDGHFRAYAEANGVEIGMTVDTGATTVVLRGSDAEKAGVEIASLAYDTPLSTANGMTYVAAVHLKSLRVGDLSAVDVEALVAKPGGLSESLLGMSFLRRLASYEVAGDFLTLRQ